MSKKLNKKLWLMVATLAFAVAFLAKPVDVKAAIAAPTGLYQSDADDDYFQFKWTENVSAVKYGTQYSRDGKQWSNESITYNEVQSYTSLSAGTTYWVRVRAYETYSVAGAWSAPLKVDTAPGEIASMKQTKAAKTSVTVKWSAAPGATGYYVYRGTDSSINNATFYKETTSTSLKIGVKKNTGYYIWVVPYRNKANAKIKVSYSAWRMGVVPSPTTPTGLKIKDRYYGSSKYTTFQWNSSSTYDNTDGYQLEVSYINSKGKNSGKKRVTISNYFTETTNISASKLFTQAFQYRVRSYVKISGKTYYSSWSSYKTYVPAAVPKSLRVSSSYSATSGTLKWNKVAGAKSYTVYWKTNRDDNWKVSNKNVSKTSAKVKYSGRSTYNYYYIRANKVKVGKKTYNSSSASKNLDSYYFY